jgi:hypothetical protein
VSSINADVRGATSINIVGSASEAHGSWKTTRRLRTQGIAWLGWSRAASRRIGLWQRLSQWTTIRSGWMSTARAILLAADLIRMPVQPSPPDVWSAQAVVDLRTEATTCKDNRKAACVMNRTITKTAIGRDVCTALAHDPFPGLPAAISHRVACAESAVLGQSVLKGEPSGAAAHESIAWTRAAVAMRPHAETNRTRDRHTTIG